MMDVMQELLDVVARLRGPDGCPWDRKQTLKTLKPGLIEECYEVLDAIDSDDPAHHREELGDLLLQVVFQAQIRREENAFVFEDVARELVEKLIRRHPHVFGDQTAESSEDVLKHWEAIKATEKGPGDHSVVDGSPKHLPALQKAHRVQSRAARVGFDWPDHNGVFDKIKEELAEVREAMDADDADAVEEELGDLLFSVVNLCRYRNLHAEDVLQAAVEKFVERFRKMEFSLRDQGKPLQSCTLEEMDAEWNAAKLALIEKL